MNRRGFLRSMLGVAAVTALPSEVFPFRKIFLPENPKPIDPYTWAGLARSPYPGRLSVPLKISDIELEVFAKQIPDLIFRDTPMYQYFKRRAAQAVLTNGIAFIDRNAVYTLDENEKMVQIPETRIPLDLDGEQLKYLNAAYEESKKPDLLHAPATPENIMEFIDGLESDFSKS